MPPKRTNSMLPASPAPRSQTNQLYNWFHYNSPHSIPRISMTLPQLDYLIQTPAYLSEGYIRQPFERIRPRTAHTPVE